MVAPFVGLWRLRAATDRIGAALLVGTSQQAWVELNLSGVHWIDRKRTGISVFDKSTGSRKPAPSLPNGRLVGADGVRLIYQNGDQLRWVPGLNHEPVESGAVTQP